MEWDWDFRVYDKDPNVLFDVDGLMLFVCVGFGSVRVSRDFPARRFVVLVEVGFIRSREVVRDFLGIPVGVVCGFGYFLIVI